MLKSAGMPFEIERKFLVKGDAWRGVAEPGGTCVTGEGMTSGTGGTCGTGGTDDLRDRRGDGLRDRRDLRDRRLFRSLRWPRWSSSLSERRS